MTKQRRVRPKVEVCSCRETSEACVLRQLLKAIQGGCRLLARALHRTSTQLAAHVSLPHCTCRSDVTCCSHGQHTAVRDGLAATTVGHCLVTSIVGLEGPPNVIFQPTSIQCRLTRAAATCGPDDCGDLVLSGEGEAVRFLRVVIEGTLPEVTNGCPQFGGNRRTTLTLPLTVDDATQRLLDAAKEAGREAEARGDAVVNIGESVFFYSGPISVQSRTRATKWEDGWFTYAAVQFLSTTTEQGLATLEASLGTLPRVTAQDFNTFKFDLYRDRESF